MGRVSKIEDIVIVAETIGDAGVEKDLVFGPEAVDGVIVDEATHLDGELQVHYELECHGDDVQASVRVRGKLIAECARCLEPVEHEIVLDLFTTYMPAEEDMPEDLEAERQSAEIGYYRRRITLGEFIVSELVLSLPLRYECSPDCRGLCINCGANLNRGPCSCEKPVDPRFEKLNNWKKPT